MILKDRIRENSPEIFGGLTILAGACLAGFGCLNLDIDGLAGYSSTITQVLAAYSGLVLTAYTVFHGMRLNSADYFEKRLEQKSVEIKSAARDSLDSIHLVFKRSIQYLSTFTIGSSVLYLVTLLRFPVLFDGIPATAINGFAGSLLLAAVITGTLNVVGAVLCLYNLRGL